MNWMILILQFATGHIIVVPINVQSDLDSPKKDNDDKDDKDDKIDHWDIYEEMIRISINNPLNWYSF